MCHASAVGGRVRATCARSARSRRRSSPAAGDTATQPWRAAPVDYAELLAGRDGSQRHPALRWSAGAYVCYVVDNLRIWGERLAALAFGAVGPVIPYDENQLAEARGYDAIPIQGALWSLKHAAADWTEALALASEARRASSTWHARTLTTRTTMPGTSNGRSTSRARLRRR